MRNLIVLIHGILTRTTDPSWPDRFSAYLHQRVAGHLQVEKRDYFAGPLPIWNHFVRNPRIAKGLAKEIALYVNDVRYPEWPDLNDTWRIYFAAHSNGCPIALRTALELARMGIPTEAMVLTASVTDPDVRRSGVLDMVRSGVLRRAVLYASDSDLPLRLPLKWPYRDAGRRGWTMAELPFSAPGVITRRFDGYGHGGYFARENRMHTFAMIRQDFGI
jgi:hypothetical protein